MMQAETFRADLYYRLNVFPIHLPALRERKADILLLADHFVDRFNQRHGRAVRRITPAIDLMMAYHWPGNVRELENSVERAVLMARDDVLRAHHLPTTLQTAESSGTASDEPLQVRLDALEYELVVDALKACSGNMTRAARRLGITDRIMGFASMASTHDALAPQVVHSRRLSVGFLRGAGALCVDRRTG